MSEFTVPPATSPSAPASAPAWSFPRRLVAVFTSPRALFEHLAERPSWAVAMLVLLLIMVVYVVATWSGAWLPEIMAKMEEQGSPEQALDMITNNGLVMYSTMIPIVAGIITVVYAACVMFVGGFLLGGRLSFRQALSVVTHAGLVGLVALPIRILLANAAQSARVTLGPGALMPVDQQEGFVLKFLATFLQSLDLFSLWQTALVAIGVAVIGRVALKGSMIAMFGLFLAFSLIGALVGAAFGG